MAGTSLVNISITEECPTGLLSAKVSGMLLCDQVLLLTYIGVDLTYGRDCQ